MCFEAGKIKEEEMSDLERLRNVTFYAEWWDGDVPTYEDTAYQIR